MSSKGMQMKSLYAVHRWLGLLALGQVSIWFLTGLVMSSLPIGQVRGDETRAPPSTPPIDWKRVVMPSTDAVSGAEEVSLRMLDGAPVYEVRGKETRLLDAASGLVVEVDAPRAGRIAQADQRGPPPVVAIERIEAPTVEYREKPVPAWAVHLADEASTTVYIDARSGRVSARRNNSWRVFDFVWGLHIMDWRERKDFNTLLLSGFAAAALAMAVSGGAIWVFRALRRRRL